MVYRKAVASGRVLTSGVPQCRVEHDHRAGRTLDRDRPLAKLVWHRRLGLLVRRGNQQRSARFGAEVINSKEGVDRHPITVQHAREILVKAMLEHVLRPSGWEDQTVLDM